MPCNHAAIVVLFHLMIEIIVNNDRFTHSDTQIRNHFHLDGSIKKRADSLRIVDHKLFTDIILKSTIPIRRTAETGAADRF